jgi:hypothetical protein
VTRNQVIDLLRTADPVSEMTPASDGFPSITALLHRIDERSTDMQTEERPLAQTPQPRDRRPRWLVPALAGAAAVIIAIVVGVVVFGGESDGPDVIEPTPTTAALTTTLPPALAPAEVGAALNEAAAAGDWEAVRRLYAEDATFSIDVGDIPDSSIISDAPLAVPFPPGRPLVAPFPILNQFDWDDDGVISGFDDIAATTMTLWALGVEPYRSCREVDATTLVCDERGQGPFSSPPDLPIYSEIFTVVDGRITQHALDLSAEDSFSPVGFVVPPLPVEYEDWVRANRPELNPDGALFEFLGKLLITPDTVEVHRQLIAEWVAQR